MQSSGLNRRLFNGFLQRATGSVTESRMPTPCDAVLRYLIHCGFFCGLLPDPLEREHSCFCAQVHGIANDTIKFVQNIINTEINSATDNPVSFPQKQEIPPRFLNERPLSFFS